MKKLFVVSDIHGHYTLMKEALDRAGFDKENPEHLLICCGDYFDRGTENQQVLRFFQRLKHKVLLCGNHEDMLLKLLDEGKLRTHHYMNGTLNTVWEFFGKYAIDPVSDRIDFSGKTGTVNNLISFIEELEDYYETEDYVFLHGWLPHNGETEEGRKEADKEAWEESRWWRWNMEYSGERPLADKTLVCGHVPTYGAKVFQEDRKDDDSSIFYGNGLIAIDAGTATSRQVNVLVLDC